MLLFLRQFKYLHLLLTDLLLFPIHSPYDAMRVCSVAMLCPTLCETMDCSQPGSSVYGIFQARMLEWVAISSSSLNPGTEPMSVTYLALTGVFFTSGLPGKPIYDAIGSCKLTTLVVSLLS